MVGCRHNIHERIPGVQQINVVGGLAGSKMLKFEQTVGFVLAVGLVLLPFLADRHSMYV